MSGMWKGEARRRRSPQHVVRCAPYFAWLARMSLAVALVGAAGWPQIPAPQTCTALPGEEAGELLRRVVRDELVPRLSRSWPWKVPEYARAVGVRFGDNESVAYGAVAAKAQIFIYLGNLAAVYPTVESHRHPRSMAGRS